MQLEAQGKGVRGYLLAPDGEEAELQDIKRLVLTCSAPYEPVIFSGHASLSCDVQISVSAQATHDGRIVSWSSTRTILGPRGRVAVVVDSVD